MGLDKMRIYIEVLQVNGEHILSENVRLDGGSYNMRALSMLYSKIGDMVLTKRISNIRFSQLETRKQYDMFIKLNESGNEYDVVTTKDRDEHPTREQVVKDVCDYFGISESTLRAETNKRTTVKPRQFAMLLFWVACKNGITTAGAEFMRDHATALYAIKVAIPSYYVAKDKEILGAIEYFSIKYGIDVGTFINDIARKGRSLNDIKFSY